MRNKELVSSIRNNFFNIWNKNVVTALVKEDYYEGVYSRKWMAKTAIFEHLKIMFYAFQIIDDTFN